MVKKYQKICTIILVSIIVLSAILLMHLQKTYVVTFDTKGGTIYPAVRVHPNEKVLKPENPMMEGYTFEGWYVAGTDEEYNFNNKVISDITITAKWQMVS